MKFWNSLFLGAAFLLAQFVTHANAAAVQDSVYETTNEFFVNGDFDGDGQADVAIVDKASGKYRLGYFSTNGVFSWVECRPSGIKGVTSVAVGHLLNVEKDAMAFTAPDGNQLALANVSSPSTPERPIFVPFTVAIGPSFIAAIDIPGPQNSPLLDFYIGSIYNSPDPNLATLLRNDGKAYPRLDEETLSSAPAKGNRFPSGPSGHDQLWLMLAGDNGDTLQIQDLGSGKPATVMTLPAAAGSDYAAGQFGEGNDWYALLYKAGEAKLAAAALGKPGGSAKSFNLGAPIKKIFVLNEESPERLFVIFGQGEKAGVFNFDGTEAPALRQTIVSTNELIEGVSGMKEGMTVFSRPAASKFSTRYLAYEKTGQSYTFKVFGTLPSLADNDNITIPDIYDRITANVKVHEESEMKPYTNTIPGTQVTYAMVPIRGGEFTMGSPASEPNRKADEGPQHKVKVSPFWMQQCEVTWNQYELFMYPDEERRERATHPSDSEGDKLADAVTHPSKPYVEMSFGMGKDNFPAIAMTQHAANKFCQWLSAKTGEFYRLPTEAEWEYACRAGTTTTYFFGDDPSKLKDYAWYEDNSDFKYQKVGKKKPNPWGLYDMYGNVTEWVLDQYDPNYYQRCAALGTVTNPWNKATQPYPLAVRGGSWDDEAALCRSAARRGSERAWKMQDPQLPKSIWYFSDAQFVGFRIVRPLKVPSAEQMQKYWSNGVERD